MLIIGSCIKLSAEMLMVFDLLPATSDTMHGWIFSNKSLYKLVYDFYDKLNKYRPI